MNTDHSGWSLDCKVYIGGLGSGADKDEIENIFGRYGNIKNLWVARNPPGFAFIEYHDFRDADDAVHGLDGTLMNNRRIRVEKATGKAKSENKYKGIIGEYDRSSSVHSRSRSRSYSHSRLRSPYSDRSRSRSRSRRRGRRRSRSYTPQRDYDSRSRSRSRQRDRSLSRKYHRSRRRHYSSSSRSRSSDNSEYSNNYVTHNDPRTDKYHIERESRSKTRSRSRSVSSFSSTDDNRSLQSEDIICENNNKVKTTRTSTIGIQTDYYLLLHYVQKVPEVLSEVFLRLDREKVLTSDEYTELIPSVYQKTLAKQRKSHQSKHHNNKRDSSRNRRQKHSQNKEKVRSKKHKRKLEEKSNSKQSTSLSYRVSNGTESSNKRKSQQEDERGNDKLSKEMPGKENGSKKDDESSQPDEDKVATNKTNDVSLSDIVLPPKRIKFKFRQNGKVDLNKVETSDTSVQIKHQGNEDPEVKRGAKDKVTTWLMNTCSESENDKNIVTLEDAGRNGLTSDKTTNRQQGKFSQSKISSCNIKDRIKEKDRSFYDDHNDWEDDVVKLNISTGSGGDLYSDSSKSDI